MPAEPKKKTSPVVWIGVAAAAVLAVFTLTGGDPPAKAKANNRFTGGASSRTKGDELFRPEDYTAKFPPVNLELRNAFRPLIVKESTTLGNAPGANGENELEPLAPNGIPASFTGGDPNWVYTGNAVVDGTPKALLENPQSGDGVFLSPGQKWKLLTLVSVRTEGITLLGPAGRTRKIAILDPFKDAPSPRGGPVGAAGATPGGTLPAPTPNGTTPLAGAIGDPNAAAQAQTADPNAQNTGNGNPNGRRRRRNRN